MIGGHGPVDPLGYATGCDVYHNDRFVLRCSLDSNSLDNNFKDIGDLRQQQIMAFFRFNVTIL